MAAPQLFVSHAVADRERVQQLLRPIRNLPVEVLLAGDELDGGTVRRDVEGQLAGADQVVAFLTDRAVRDPLVNQEVGYATAAEIPILPVVTDPDNLLGYVSDADPVHYDDSDLEETAFELITELRDRLEPVGSLSTPNWFLQFACTHDGCGHEVRLEIDEPQAVLRTVRQHDELLSVDCPDCGTRYEFNPLTLGFVRSVAPHRQ